MHATFPLGKIILVIRVLTRYVPLSVLFIPAELIKMRFALTRMFHSNIILREKQKQKQKTNVIVPCYLSSCLVP